MPAAGGIKKAELYLESPEKRCPVVKGNPLEPFLRPISPVIKVGSYVALWKNPRLSAYTFIWLNICFLLQLSFTIATPLTTTLVLLLLTTNALMIEYSFTKQSSVGTAIWYNAVGVTEEDLTLLPGSSEASQMIVNGVNGLCNVFLNLRDTSEQGHAHFYFALCTVVAMTTIVLSYLATATTFLVLFWFLFYFPAIKHHQLYKKVTQEQIASVFNMSVCMMYNMYTTVVQALADAPELQEEAEGADQFGDSLHSEYDREMSDPATSLRSTTMSYLRGLPSAMTLNWGNGLKTWIRRRRGGESATPSGIEMSGKITVTESDSDFGIDDIDEDGGGQPTTQKVISETVDTLSSNPDMEFPSIERRDTWDSEVTLAEGLDPALLYDEEDNTFTLDSESGFSLGGTQRLHLLDAVAESDEESERTEISPISEISPEFQTIRSQQCPGTIDPLDGINYMIQPTPPAAPRATSIPTSSPLRRIKQSEQNTRSDTTDDVIMTSSATDSEFYVISDEDIRAADMEVQDQEVSSVGSASSLTARIAGGIRTLSGGSDPSV